MYYYVALLKGNNIRCHSQLLIRARVVVAYLQRALEVSTPNQCRVNNHVTRVLILF